MILMPSSGPMRRFAPGCARVFRAVCRPSNGMTSRRSRAREVWAYASLCRVGKAAGREASGGVPTITGQVAWWWARREGAPLPTLRIPHHLAQLGLQHLAVVVLRQGLEIDVAF